MLHTVKNHKATFLLITIWTILYLLGKRLDLLSPLAGRGIDVMGRFPMGVFLYWPNFCFAAFKAGLSKISFGNPVWKLDFRILYFRQPAFSVFRILRNRCNSSMCFHNGRHFRCVGHMPEKAIAADRRCIAAAALMPLLVPFH